jgi:lipopolysaccharide export system protein LptA
VLEGIAKYVDSINHIIVVGNRIEVNKKTNAFLATQKPVVVIVKDKDSTYIAADTLFSGLRKNDGTFSKKKIITKNKRDSSSTSINKIDSTSNENVYVNIDTVNNKQILNKAPKDSVRYILGYQHVKIYNDSAQAVCDSMYYSTEDSVFRMFKNPVVWQQKNQITGDTMYLFTEKQQPKRIYVFTNAMVVNMQNPAMYNQAGGRTLNGYFKDGKIDYARIKGSPAETVFYPQAEDSSYTGMNTCSGDVADVYFVKEEINKIKFINNVNGIMFPLNQIPSEKKYLKNFSWQDKRRPKNKLELFE